METFKRTPLQLFNLPQHFVVPLFQRPYVWKEDEQWEPLWKDIQRVAEVGITDPHLEPKHFLGAVVLQAHQAGSNQVTAWNVIDGQQRLTTLQILMDAAGAVLAQAGMERQASQLEALTHNSPNFISDGESRLKVRHLNRDRASYDEVMNADPPVDHGSLQYQESRVARAHRYFTAAVSQWLGDPRSHTFAPRAERLANVLQMDLQLVTIELSSAENSQEIFETLNARGTPLTAADLVRNFVFQRLEAEGGDVRRAYQEDWPFESKFWSKEVSVGRYRVSRSSLFLNQWLIAQLGEEISPQATFTRFKWYVEHQAGVKIVNLMPLIKQQAERYEEWTQSASRSGGDLTPVEMAVYRMQASGIELLKPLLIWLFEPGRDAPVDAINRVIQAAESWVYRRQLLRLPGSDLGRIVADVIASNSGVPGPELAQRIASHLARLDATSTYWPGDEEVRAALLVEPVYRRYPRARLRMFLEAIENHYRAETSQPQVERAVLPVEHLLPQSWRDNWPVSGLDEDQDRQEHVHRLGNLTLVTQSLNSKISNAAWPTKRRALLEHNTIKLTGRLVEDASEWDEQRIDDRSADLVNVLLKVWTVPSGHQGRVVDPQAKAQDWVEIRHLVAAGLLSAGDRLTPSYRGLEDRAAAITDDGFIEIDGTKFSTPSGAGTHLLKKPINGWLFWVLPDGRRLRDVRAEFRAIGNTDRSEDE